MPTTSPHFTCHTRQPKHSTPSLHSTSPPTPSFPPLLEHLSPLFLLTREPLFPKPPHPTSSPKTFEDIQKFLDMTENNVPLPHPPSNPPISRPSSKYLPISILLPVKFPQPFFLPLFPYTPHPLLYLHYSLLVPHYPYLSQLVNIMKSDIKHILFLSLFFFIIYHYYFFLPFLPQYFTILISDL